MNCITHHHACDCREAAHARKVASLRAEIEAQDETIKCLSAEAVRHANDASEMMFARDAYKADLDVALAECDRLRERLAKSEAMVTALNDAATVLARALELVRDFGRER